MIDFLKNILEASRDRLKSPILGAFSLAFILFNWKPILILLFSVSSIENKIDIITYNYSSFYAILCPLFITIIITIGIPYAMLAIDSLLVSPQNRRRGIQNKTKLVTLDHKIQIAEKEFTIQERKSGTRNIEMLQQTIDAHQDTIEALRTENNSLITTFNIERDQFRAELNEVNNRLNIELEANRINANKIFFSEETIDAYKALIDLEKEKSFYSLFDLNYTLIDESESLIYENLGLINTINTLKNDNYTDLGKQVYILSFELKRAQKEKKELINVIDNLNKHELSVIKEIDNYSEDHPDTFDNISNSTKNRLIELGFLKRNSKTQGYSLTEKGNELKNLVFLIESGHYRRHKKKHID